MRGQVEGTGFEAFNARFGALLTGHGRVERLWTGGRCRRHQRCPQRLPVGYSAATY